MPVPAVTLERQIAASRFRDLVAEAEIDAAAGLTLEPYAFLLLRPLG